MRALVLILAASLGASAAKWTMSLLHDEDESALILRAIAFPTEQRGLAIGQLTEKKGVTGVVLLTTNGGAKWETIRVKEDPVSISCVKEEICWFVSVRGVWRSDEGGRAWKKIASLKGPLKVHFSSPARGWAAGLAKSAWETNDGGKTWKAIEKTKEISSNPDHAYFSAIAVNQNVGIIGGNSRAPRKEDDVTFPDWMQPEAAAKRREWPAVMILIETRDGGKTWNPSSNQIFGSLTQIRIKPEGTGAAALLEYFNNFEFPAELMWIDFRSGRSSSIMRSKDFAPTDHVLAAENRIVVAGIENAALRALPVPQKVKFYEATVNDATTTTAVWASIPVDYRAVAKRVALGLSPNGIAWAVTDTGMILKLDPSAR
ncbi:MAG: hypothetical protein FJW38_07235 [Acidobacteria bacterium]|nr:hypothetical protein [Acidobacteriota bacterium]